MLYDRERRLRAWTTKISANPHYLTKQPSIPQNHRIQCCYVLTINKGYETYFWHDDDDDNDDDDDHHHHHHHHHHYDDDNHNDDHDDHGDHNRRKLFHYQISLITFNTVRINLVFPSSSWDGGAAPTEWSTILFPTKVPLILEVWG